MIVVYQREGSGDILIVLVARLYICDPARLRPGTNLDILPSETVARPTSAKELGNLPAS